MKLVDRAVASLRYRTGLQSKAPQPADPFDLHWYYTAELEPGRVAQGIFPDTLPLLPRILLRGCQVEGAECLDIGSMEGLIPIIASKRGASRVLALDASDHCQDKMNLLKSKHQVTFDYKSVGLMYDLQGKLPGQSFDFINCSGLLYHVYSPLMVLAGIRALLKRNGLMVVSTNVINSDGFFMEFNNGGRLQEEPNTFWYISIELLDYMLRLFRLTPVDCLYISHDEIKADFRFVTDKPSGYLSVVCRASDEQVAGNDEWMKRAAQLSWEYIGLTDWDRAITNPVSDIGYSASERLDLMEAVRDRGSYGSAKGLQDTHALMLSDSE
jgi:2-polyprenyl-3-methyl-5-hydroxy-6-metoxy-1,4-benzoquinol methylase